MSLICTVSRGYQTACRLSTAFLSDVSDLLLRLLLAKVFLSSGVLKWRGWFDFDELTYDLFLYEFFCPDPVREGALQLCNPETLEYQDGSLTVQTIQWFAVSAGVLEVLLPVLLIVGLFTRFAALGLLVMTLFIQLAVFPQWSHWWNPAAWWAVVALAILVNGPGRISVDSIFGLDRK